MTRADKIRAMSDEEMVKYFATQTIGCDLCIHKNNPRCAGKCITSVAAYLQQEDSDGKT